MIRRTTEYCLDRLKILSSGSSDNDYNNSDLRQYWMPDNVSTDCYDCSLKFTTFRRKHHCRVCGQIFCWKCCNIFIDGKKLGFSDNTQLRVCKFCSAYFEKYLEGQKECEAFSLTKKSSVHSESQSYLGGASPSYPISSKKNSIVFHPLEINNIDDETVFNSGKLDSIWSQILHPETGVSKNKYFTGAELLAWLESYDPSIDDQKSHHIGTALLTSGYIGSQELNDTFIKNDVVYFSLLDVNESDYKSEDPFNGPDWLLQVQVQGNDSGFSQKVSKNHSMTFKSTPVLYPYDKLSNEPHIIQETLSRQSCSNYEVVFENYVDVVTSLLLKEEKCEESKWKNVILSLVKSLSDSVSMEGHDFRQVIKIKKIPGGSPELSSIIPGEVFRGNSHGNFKRMNHPRIMCVCGSVVFQTGRYISFDSFAAQEMEYVKNITSKIKRFSPNIILVEETVSFSAKEILFDADIVLIMNVKRKILERVCRLFGTPLFVSLDASPTMLELGSCKEFNNVSYSIIPDQIVSSNYVFLSGENAFYGCTVLLRGGCSKELSQVKRIIQSLLLLSMNSKCEKAFLENEFVQLEVDWNETYNKLLDLNTLSLSPFVMDSSSIQSSSSSSSSSRLSNTTTKKSQEFNENDEDCFSCCTSEKEKEMTSFYEYPELLVRQLTSGLEDEEILDLVREFRGGVTHRPPFPIRYHPPRLYIRQKTKNKTSKEYQKESSYYEKWNSKSLIVLFSSHSSQSKTAPNYCIQPWMVNMNYYGSQDCSLGTFLDTFCFSSDYKCPNKECETPMKYHIRRFVHHRGCVLMYIQERSKPIHGMKDTEGILMWKYCGECQKIGSAVNLSQNSWNYSFASFLSLLFYERSLTQRSFCHHSLHQCHYTCFARGLIVVSFKYTPLKLYTLVFPPKSICIPRSKVSAEDLSQEVNDLAVKGSITFGEIHEWLLAVSPKDFSDCGSNELLQVYSSEYSDNYAIYRNKIQRLHIGLQEDKEEERQEFLEDLQKSILGLKYLLATTLKQWTLKISAFNALKKKEEKNTGGSVTLSSSTRSRAISGEQEESNSSSSSKMWSAFVSNSNECIFTIPFESTSHYGLSPLHPVDELQPSSIISFTLSTDDYRAYIKKCEESFNSETQCHFEYEFSDGEQAKFYCKSYFAYKFEVFRSKFLSIPLDFIRSLSRCRAWKASGGKSGLCFYKTEDDRFILKQMSIFEFRSFRKFSLEYFDYVGKSLEGHSESLLAKILGVYKIGFKNNVSKNSLNIDLLVIENIFYGHEIKESYDLKGSIRNRFVDDSRNSSLVLLDENLLKDSCEHPLFIVPLSHQNLLGAIASDTSFLTSQSMMDYSLLVGKTEESQLIVGIIDYIRTYTVDKVAETFIKKSGLLGGTRHPPTVLPPVLYERRFINAMNKYFISVPQ